MEKKSDSNCIFCKIANQEIATKLLFQSDEVVAFADLHPQAPTHVLVIPKEHIAALSQCEDGHQALLGQLLISAKRIAAQMGLDSKGYRVNINTGKFGGQTVDHLHVHLLGGRAFHWPPG